MHKILQNKLIYSALGLVAALCTVLCTGCTHNNGDIGPWFGTWKLVSIEPDDTGYGGNVFWKFQGTVIEMDECTTPDIEYTKSFGTWEHKGDELVLTFVYGDNGCPPGSDKYLPIASTGLPGGVTVLHIEKLTGSEAVLRLDEPRRTYRLKKWN